MRGLPFTATNLADVLHQAAGQVAAVRRRRRSESLMTTVDLGMPLTGTQGVPRLAEGAPAQTKKDFTSDQEVRWCPGCGDYAILAAMQGFLPELG